MISITPALAIDENEIQLDYVRASGPGGQNVNKVATAVQLRFDVLRSSLPEDVRQRLVRLAGRRVNAEGVLILDARQFRTQEQNRADALARLIRLIRQAAAKPRPRHKTRPTLAEKQRRLESKKRRGRIKGLRNPVRGTE
ncbi:MAG: aminoacyl-tRNA hydrolase [Chloroflexi bacterium]|nr:aminoacyl-tRNA hydrolase [Chloroflexota bacterium]